MMTARYACESRIIAVGSSLPHTTRVIAASTGAIASLKTLRPAAESSDPNTTTPARIAVDPHRIPEMQDRQVPEPAREASREAGTASRNQATRA